MTNSITRRGCCIIGLTTLSLAGYIDVRAVRRSRRRITTVRSNAGTSRSWEVDGRRGDHLILRYQADAATPSRLRIEASSGQVVFDEPISLDEGEWSIEVSYRLETPGVHTIHLEWGTRARVKLFILE